jgi:predicted exporter
VQAAPKLRYPLLVLVVLSAALLAARGNSVWNDRLGGLSPVPEADQQWYERLQKDLGAPDARYLVVASHATQQGVLETAEQVGAVLERLQE